VKRGSVKSEAFKDAVNIPVACHYNNDTLLTKDGALLQTIKVTGFFRDFSCAGLDIRQQVRKAIQEHIPDTTYAIYFHTIRDRKDILPKGDYHSELGIKINEAWCKQNNWDKQLSNTLYITIIKQGLADNILNVTSFLEGLFFPLVKKHHMSFLQEACTGLTEVSDKIIESLNTLGSTRLTLRKTQQGYISEPLSFYHNLTHLKYKACSPPIDDLSHHLANLDIRYSFSDMVITDEVGSRIATIFTLKEYHELPTNVFDKFMQLGMQFIITECIHFTPAEPIREEFEAMKEFCQIARAEKVAQLNGIDEMLVETEHPKGTEYCKSQITVLIHSDDQAFFQKRVEQASAAFSEIGLVMIREDFNMARCFWSQLPGNFRYLCRQKPLATRFCAGFSSIHHSKLGSFNGSSWGPPTTLFRMIEGNPHYFNFHGSSGNGHTILIGPDGAGKSILGRFLIAQAEKLSPRIISIDLSGSTDNFIRSLGGTVLTVNRTHVAPIKLNPYLLENYGGNSELMYKWLEKAIHPRGDLHEKHRQLFADMANKVASLLPTQPTVDIKRMVQETIANTADNTLIQGFNDLMAQPYYDSLFTQGADELSPLLQPNAVINIDLADIAQDRPLLSLYLSTLLMKLLKINSDSRQPTIIYMDDAPLLFGLSSFTPLLIGWLDALQAQNCMVVLSTTVIKPFYTNVLFKSMLGHFNTQILMADKYADKNFKRLFELTDSDFYRIKSFDGKRHAFMLRQPEIGSLMGTINLTGMDEILEKLK
jgi:type IV secretion system protein VirB4